jgi:hypothetical protein
LALGQAPAIKTADAAKGASRVPIATLTVSDQRLPAVTGYINLWVL